MVNNVDNQLLITKNSASNLIQHPKNTRITFRVSLRDMFKKNSNFVTKNRDKR